MNFGTETMSLTLTRLSNLSERPFTRVRCNAAPRATATQRIWCERTFSRFRVLNNDSRSTIYWNRTRVHILDSNLAWDWMELTTLLVLMTAPKRPISVRLRVSLLQQCKDYTLLNGDDACNHVCGLWIRSPLSVHADC